MPMPLSGIVSIAKITENGNKKRIKVILEQTFSFAMDGRAEHNYIKFDNLKKLQRCNKYEKSFKFDDSWNNANFYINKPLEKGSSIAKYCAFLLLSMHYLPTIVLD